MATSLGSVGFSWGSYELAYDLLGQNIAGNYSTVRLYGILHVTGSYVSWSRGSASVHTSGLQSIGTYYSRGDHTVITRDFTFGHDNSGNFSMYIGASLSTTYTSGDTGGTLTLPSIPRQANITGASNFTDETNPSIAFSNPGGFRINARLEFGGTNIQRNNIPNTGYYTFSLTDNERKLLRQKCTGNSMGVREVIATCIGSSSETHWSWADRTMTMVNANPTFSNFEFEDTNSVTTALTGNNQNVIVNYSNIKATVSTTNKAEAIKEATMKKYRLVIGETSADINYSSDSNVSVQINNASSGTFNMYAIDSRNNSTMVTKLANSVINYENIYIDKQNSSFARNNNQVGENGILTLKGTFWNGDFGEVVNSITSVTYRLKKTDSSTWVDGTTTITPTVTDNDFTFTGQIASDNQDTTWDLESSYNVEVTISDELSSTTINFILNSGIPTLCLDKQGVGIMGAYDSSLGGYLQVNGTVIDGGKILWTNPNPSSSITSATNITLTDDNYDMYKVIYKHTNTSSRLLSIDSIKGYGCVLQTNSSGMIYRRFVDYNNDTSLTISTENSGNSNNNNLIPIYIIGYKTGLFN